MSPVRLKISLKIKHMSYSKIFALVNKKASKKNRHFVSLESRDSFDKKLRKAEDYKTVYGEDLGNLFIPWEIDSSNDTRKGFKGDFEDPKNMGSGETPDQHPLYPFKYNPKESGVLYQQGSVQDSDSLHSLVSSDRYRLGPDIHRDVTSMRGVGLRLPIIAKGWGHDDVGNPVPSGLTRDKFLNSQDPAKPYINGYEVDPKDYIAAPIDFSYNKERKVWTIQHERVFAKLERKGPSPYAWKEVWKKQDTVGSVLGWKYKPSGLNDVDEGFALQSCRKLLRQYWFYFTEWGNC